MKRALLSTVALLALAAPQAQAQSDILLRLRSGSPLGDRFRVDSAGGVVALGNLGIGIIPASGNTSGGVRMMWYPYKGAFRAGAPGTSGSTAWDDANVGFYTWAGGFNSIATGIYSLSHGENTISSGQWSVALGDGTEAAGSRSFAMGWDNQARSLTSFAVGRETFAGLSFRSAPNGQGGAMALGHRVTADADWSVALGYRASVAGHVGSFVFGGSLAGASAAADSIRSTADGQVTFRNPGGFRIFSNTAATVGVQVNAGGSSWNVISDRNRKESFLSLDPQEILARVRGLPVTTWRYRDEQDRSVRHIGPMAQDWHRAFGFSGDRTTINMSDFDGVNLAAIQALDAEVLRLRAENAELRAALQRDGDELRARLERVEALLAQRP